MVISVPPETPVIQDQTNGSIVRVPHEQESLALTCNCLNGKPAAAIFWQRNDINITEEDGVTIAYSSETLSNKLENAQSILSIKPRSEDNGASYKCLAWNPAIVLPLETMIELSVMRKFKPELARCFNT